MLAGISQDDSQSKVKCAKVRDGKEIVQEMIGECAVGSGEVGYVDQAGIVDGRGIDAYKMDTERDCVSEKFA